MSIYSHSNVNIHFHSHTTKKFKFPADCWDYELASYSASNVNTEQLHHVVFLIVTIYLSLTMVK